MVYLLCFVLYVSYINYVYCWVYIVMIFPFFVLTYVLMVLCVDGFIFYFYIISFIQIIRIIIINHYTYKNKRRKLYIQSIFLYASILKCKTILFIIYYNIISIQSPLSLFFILRIRYYSSFPLNLLVLVIANLNIYVLTMLYYYYFDI